MTEKSIPTYQYADVILPIAIPKPYTYAIPEVLADNIRFGVRVEVQFGNNKLYAGLVIKLHNEKPSSHTAKFITSILDQSPIIHQEQYDLWSWMATYYSCTIGEVMHAALPAGLKLTSETSLVLTDHFEIDQTLLDDDEFLLAEALTIQKEITIEDARGILGKKTIYPVIKRLLNKSVIHVKEELQKRYKPKLVKFVSLTEAFGDDPENLHLAFDSTQRSEKQTSTLLAYIQLSKKNNIITKKQLEETANVNGSVIAALVKKEIFVVHEKEVSRIGSVEQAIDEAAMVLSGDQQKALDKIQEQHEEKTVVLLHGVTGSGKTNIYIEMLKKCIAAGQQALYLLPEIAISAQIIKRLQKVFGTDIEIYHSRLNNNERVEIWNAVVEGKPIILGVRSSVFLPFKDLGLIIVDEEHDRSYKQFDPAPRYNARDSATVIGALFKAKVLLGTATPSVETYYNATLKKYGYVSLLTRYSGIELPEMQVIDLIDQMRRKKLKENFSEPLIEAIQVALQRNEQVILFKNRRGHSPILRCGVCAWTAQCINCDISLTYHKYSQNIRCHYCAYRKKMDETCPACGNEQLELHGMGTEKIEDELKLLFPEAKIGRMDLDTVRTKNAHSKIIEEFETGALNILVGTQMVTKGLDFDNVGVVGILNADHSLNFPNFRAAERTFQLLTQVAGRAGRKNKRGLVVVQSYQPKHPIIQQVLENDYQGFFQKEIAERKAFQYPPFNRIIHIQLKHKKAETVFKAADIFGSYLKGKLGKAIIGPAVPPVPRLRSFFLMDVLIKVSKKNIYLSKVKKTIADARIALAKSPGCSGVRVNVDVDPY